MLKRSFVQAMKTKRHIDEFVTKLQGDFGARTAKDVREAFAFDYRSKHQIQSFALPSNSANRLSDQERDFIVSAISAYNRTCAEEGKLQKAVDSFKGTEKQRRFWIETLLRSMVLCRYQGKMQVTSDALLRYMEGKKLGTSDFVVHLPNIKASDSEEIVPISHPLLVVSQAKAQVPRGTPLELAACSNLFELYAYYWETVQTRNNKPLYGLATDLNSWILQKYDGETFYMCDESFKGCAHVPALEDLCRVVYTVLASDLQPTDKP
jgi:hypothetical protein